MHSSCGNVNTCSLCLKLGVYFFFSVSSESYSEKAICFSTEVCNLLIHNGMLMIPVLY